jgi:hypothetical protein
MLKIRKEQMEELAKVTVRSFEDGMVEHIKKFFPKFHEVMGEPAVRNAIRYGVDRAEVYGFKAERDVCLYINLMFLLGSDFDTDVQLPWLAAILTDETGMEPGARMDKAYDAAMEYLDDVAGVENEHAGSALKTIPGIPFHDFSLSATGNVENRIGGTIRKVWPRKVARLGEELTRRLIRNGIENAGRYGITVDRGVAVYVVLMFMAGGGFDRDPLLPWAGAVLSDKSIADQSARVGRLYGEMMAFLEKWSAS